MWYNREQTQVGLHNLQMVNISYGTGYVNEVKASTSQWPTRGETLSRLQKKYKQTW